MLANIGEQHLYICSKNCVNLIST